MAMFEVRINGKKEYTAPGSIAEILKDKKIKAEAVTVEINDELLPKRMYDKYMVKPGDRIEFVYHMGGGYGKA